MLAKCFSNTILVNTNTARSRAGCLSTLIETATLVCYPMGSFFTSLVATISIDGIGEEIAKNPYPKAYIPNTTIDQENIGLSILDEINLILETLKKNNKGLNTQDLMNFIIVDGNHGERNFSDEQRKEIKNMGINIIDTDLLRDKKPLIDEKKLIPVLLSLSN